MVEHWFDSPFLTTKSIVQRMRCFGCHQKNVCMRQLLLYSFALIVLVSCRKDHQHGTQVDIYLLKSFVWSIDSTKTPVVTTITNAVLNNTPLIADADIEYYTKDTYTYTLNKSIESTIRDYGLDKGFAVTVNQRPIYYGRFQPQNPNSFPLGQAVIRNSFLPKDNEVRIDFVNLTGTYVSELDKRNDIHILNAFKATGRLR